MQPKVDEEDSDPALYDMSNELDTCAAIVAVHIVYFLATPPNGVWPFLGRFVCCLSWMSVCRERPCRRVVPLFVRQAEEHAIQNRRLVRNGEPLNLPIVAFPALHALQNLNTHYMRHVLCSGNVFPSTLTGRAHRRQAVPE